MQPQNKGPGMLWGQSYDMGAGGIGGPLSVDMRPYGCFILLRIAPTNGKYVGGVNHATGH